MYLIHSAFLFISVCIINVCYDFQAISNPKNEEYQEKAWLGVCPLVFQLKKFYEFSLKLGM